jgi:squalene-hopene/tetraprenyl-beta-curcumene cyclase
LVRILLAAACVAIFTGTARAADPEHQKKAEAMLEKAIAWLRAQQGPDGGWSVPKEGPVYPAITALVLNGMLMQPGIDEKDPAVRTGVAFLLKYRQPDGGIYDRILPSYNTSIVLSALARVGTPEAKAAIKPAQDFLRSLQFGEGAAVDGPFAKETGRVEKAHPFYGGMGYGRSGRPDLSNLSMFLQGMHDSGVPGDDPAFQRALIFLARVQMLDPVNDQPYADGSTQGGFIYSTSESKDNIGSGQSMAGTIEESLDDGSKVSRLRAYGSMTYSGFKSYLYANLPRDDPRVSAALDWIRRNYTLKENPGVGTDGLYYYFVTFARALHALGEPTITLLPPVGTAARTVTPRDWANDLIDRLAELQNDDGSFKSVDDRWLENNSVLITSYAVLALQHAIR